VAEISLVDVRYLQQKIKHNGYEKRTRDLASLHIVQDGHGIEIAVEEDWAALQDDGERAHARRHMVERGNHRMQSPCHLHSNEQPVAFVMDAVGQRRAFRQAGRPAGVHLQDHVVLILLDVRPSREVSAISSS
jgi:hypothetical protein